MPSLLAVRAFNALGKPFGINPFPRSFGNPATAGTGDRQAAFDRIYTGEGWPSGESRSGAGSELARTEYYVAQLRECLDELAVETIFDAPCGDLNWILPAAEGRRYLGGDIAPSLVADLHRTHPQLNITTF
ncbi:hypothetical protein ACFQPG_05925 [Sphingomonas sp. GCM10030256]|uniref:hypothetical protein n=1 Tax=Sphingomonas sp. GCM10030256 TaxID=3273427 RepID=UPI00360DF6EE